MLVLAVQTPHSESYYTRLLCLEEGTCDSDTQEDA